MKKLKAGHKQNNQNLPQNQEEWLGLLYHHRSACTFPAQTKATEIKKNYVVFASKYQTWLSLSSLLRSFQWANFSQGNHLIHLH